VWHYPDPSFGIYGWDGAVFFDNSLIVLAQTMSQVSGHFYNRIYLMSFLLADIPVPVELTAFAASIVGNKVILTWGTETEINNKGFEVQRSEVTNQPNEVGVSPKDGRSEWERVGFVAGYGTTSEPKTYSFTDNNINNGTYNYRLMQIDLNGTYKYSNTVEVSITGPVQYSLSQNYPNPFNPATTIKYSIPADEYVSLNVFNALGQEVAALVNGFIKAGQHTVIFDATNMASGIYYYKIESGNKVLVKKMLLLK